MKISSTVLILGLLILFAVQVGSVIVTTAPTFDEPNWVAIAWYLTHYWTWQGDYHVFMHPPLTFYLHGLPLRLLEWSGYAPDLSPPEGTLAAGFPYPYAEMLSYDAVFLLARLGMLPISAVLLWYAYRWAKDLYGGPAAVFALALHVGNPWLIAQATVIGTDLAIACGIFATLYHFRQFLRRPSLRNSAWTGLALGLTLLTRVSALLLFPLGLLSVGSLLLRRRAAIQPADAGEPAARVSVGKIAATSLLLLAIAAVVVWAGYGFDIQPARAFRPEQAQDVVARIVGDVPLPFGAYLNSIRLPQSFLFWMERSAFLAGQHLTATVWYANVLTFVVKNPIPFLVFLGLSAALWRSWRYEEMMTLLLPAGVIFLVFSLWFPVQGFRFVLPIYPFLIVWMSRIAVWDGLKKPLMRVVFGVFVGWHLLSGLTAMPDYLAYCNELIGGTAQGYRWFADADYDWGQDAKRLGQYLQHYDGPPVRLAYFGSAIPEYYGIRANPLREPEGCQPTAGLIAISATRLQGVYERNHACYAWLSNYEPIARIGATIFVYAIAPGEIPRL